MLRTLTIVASLITGSCAIANAQIQLEEVSQQWGVDHYHRGLIGGGVAIFDFNNDGFQDMYLTGGRFKDKLYKNNGNGTFLDIAPFAGLDTTIFYNTMSVVTGDINNDGFRDIFVGTDQLRHHLLFLNNGDGTFQEISQSAGLNVMEWATGAVFADFNLDGWLDLYIVNYVQRQEALIDDDGEVIGFNHSCFPNRLYLNNGDLTFIDATVETQTGDIGCGLAAVATDFNGDHHPDLLIANDFGEWVSPNVGLTNNFPDSSFINSSDARNLREAIYGMGVAEGDYNRDGYMDYYVTNLGSNVLHTAGPANVYSDLAVEAGVDNTFVAEAFTTGWGAAFVDLDHDGFEDLLVSNGDIPAARFIANDQEDPNKLFLNNGDGTFDDISSEVGFDNTQRGRGLAVGDLDNDGDQEVVVVIAAENDDSGRILIYQNQYKGIDNWFKVILQGTQVNKDAFGAKVLLYQQEELWMKELSGGSSHASQHSSLLHFGLGPVEQLDSVVVVWPGGKRQSVSNVNTDHVIRITEDQEGYQIAGCTDATAANFNASATYNYGCFIEIPGCMDPSSASFDLQANSDNGDCEVVEVVTALDDLNGNWQIYPNPMSTVTTIKTTNAAPGQLELMDLSGKTLHHAEFTSHYQLVNSGLSTGIYIIRLTSNGKSITRKLIVR